MPATARVPATDPVVSTTLVAVVIVHYRGARDTLDCVDSVREHAPQAQVIVVDNASEDGSRADLDLHLDGHDGIALLHSERNGGFGAGCNLGIAHALATWPQLEHVLLLNPDARLRPGALGALRSCAQRHGRAGIVGCRIVEPSGEIWFANGRLPRVSSSRFHCAPPGGATEYETEFVTGCCMLLDAAMLRSGVRFDESFFLYGEDADLCCTVRERGRSLWITQAATIEHKPVGSQTGQRVLGDLTAQRLYWLTRARALLARKHLPPLRRAAFWFVTAVAVPLAEVARGHGVRWIGPYFRGLWSGLRARMQSRA